MKIIYNSKIPKLIGVGGITLYPFVCVAYTKEDCSHTLIRHELIHVRQIKEVGFFKFYISYIWQYLLGRFQGLNHSESYLAISFEVEAYQNQNKELETVAKL